MQARCAPALVPRLDDFTQRHAAHHVPSGSRGHVLTRLVIQMYAPAQEEETR